MSGPEQAATVTPGQAAYEEWSKRFDGSMAEDWDKDLADSERRDWEAVAQAAIDREPGSERVAELVTEGNELRAELERWPRCPHGCGCRLGTEDADARECGCDGPCCGDDAPAVVTAGTEHLADQITRLVIPDEES